jgi:hypothetical protein
MTSAREAAAASEAARDRCRHGLLLSSAHRPADECRECVTADVSVLAYQAVRPGPTLDEVGAMFGVTRERVRQIEAVALRKLGPRLAAALGITDADRGEILSDAERRDRVVARMRRDGMTKDEITDAIGSDERARAVGNARERNAT